MSESNKKPTVAVIGTALVGGMMLSGSTFAVTPLAQGYLLGTQEAAATTEAKAQEGSCGADKASGEGKCGEGKCGMDKLDTDGDGKVSRAEFGVAHPEKTNQFDVIDANRDGFIDAAEKEAHHGAKSGAEGKCGEGKCGEGKCGGAA